MRILKDKRKASGFTLLEVLVALAVMSIGMVAVFELFSSGLRGLSASEGYVSAVIKAEARMRDLLDDEKLSEGLSTETTTDGYHFAASVKKTLEDRTEKIPVDLFEVVVTVKWTSGPRERSYTLTSMKMVPKKI